MEEYEGEGPGRARLVAIQPKGGGPPLVLVHGLGGGMLWGYAMLSKHLGLE
jgi:pimeloyl-ACP methyl ester carboxylesterase